MLPKLHTGYPVATYTALHVDLFLCGVTWPDVPVASGDCFQIEC